LFRLGDFHLLHSHLTQPNQPITQPTHPPTAPPHHNLQEEGIVVKPLDSAYELGNRGTWIKVRTGLGFNRFRGLGCRVNTLNRG